MLSDEWIRWPLWPSLHATVDRTPVVDMCLQGGAKKPGPFPNARWQMNDDRQIAAQFEIYLGLLDQSWSNLHSMWRKYCHWIFLNRNCDNRIRFETPACWIKIILQILPKIGCHGKVRWGIGKRGPDRENSRKYGEKIVKVDRTSRCWDIFGQFKRRNFGR